MKPATTFALAGLLAGATSIAFAAADRDVSKALERMVNEPVASPMKGNPDDQLLNGVVQALNNDASMKNSKISVQTDNGVVMLRGATLTREQREKATDIAVAQAGDGNVVNAIQDDET
jgi:osmotically-inducible protein OsmY